MSNIIYYCHICGNIHEREDLYKLKVKDRETKKSKVLYYVCGHCLHNLEHRRFKMPKIDKINDMKFYRLFVSGFVKGKAKQLYDVLPDQLEFVKSMEVKKEKLVLKSKDRKRIWTVFNIKDLIENNTKEMMNILLLLYEYQTDDEKVSRKTKWQNAVGFNQPDADFLTGMAKLYVAKGKDIKEMTDSQLRGVRRRLLKYAQQITIIKNA